MIRTKNYVDAYYIFYTLDVTNGEKPMDEIVNQNESAGYLLSEQVFYTRNVYWVYFNHRLTTPPLPRHIR